MSRLNRLATFCICSWLSLAKWFEGVVLKLCDTLQSLGSSLISWCPVFNPDKSNQKRWGTNPGIIIFKAHQVIPVCGQVWGLLVKKMVFIRFLMSEHEKSVSFSQRKKCPISKHLYNLTCMVKLKNEITLFNLSITNIKLKSNYHK